LRGGIGQAALRGAGLFLASLAHGGLKLLPQLAKLAACGVVVGKAQFGVAQAARKHGREALRGQPFANIAAILFGDLQMSARSQRRLAIRSGLGCSLHGLGLSPKVSRAGDVATSKAPETLGAFNDHCGPCQAYRL
jgi:hypothetical protein